MRIPASFCGLYGIRPTHGRVDLSGAVAMAPSFDVAGWFAAAPGVFRRVGEVLLGGERVDAKLTTLMLATDAFAEADAAVVNVGLEVMGRAMNMSVLPPLRDVHVVRDRFEEAARQGEAPVLVTSPAVRPFVRSIVERFRSQTSVLSQSEIHPRARLKTVGNI